MQKNKTALIFAVSFITLTLFAYTSNASTKDTNEIKRYSISRQTPIDPHDGCIYTGEVRDI